MGKAVSEKYSVHRGAVTVSMIKLAFEQKKKKKVHFRLKMYMR